MTSLRRWLIVAAGTLVLAMAPYAVSQIPVGHSDVSAAQLLGRIKDSADVPFSGYAEAHGGLALPDVDNFSELADLLGGTTDLRVWWRADKDWRVDAVSLTGETDVHRDSGGIWTWEFERNRATRTDYDQAPAARLPRADDLAPGALARRLLSQALPSEVTRIGDQRIAGEDAAGLRLVPGDSMSTIKRVEVWALPSSGLPVKVAAYGSSGGPVISATMLDVSTSTPSPADTAFTVPPTAEVENDDISDFVSAVNRFVGASPPARLAGLARASGSTSQLGSVGLYGRGVTVLVAVPLPPRFADDIEQQLSGTRRITAAADTIAFGPLTLRLTARAANGSRWLLVGTVTQRALARAESQLPGIDGFFR